MTQPSKFSRPSRPTPAQAEIDRVIGAAETRDDPMPAPALPAPEAETRFTMVLPADMGERVNTARKRAGGMARLAWIRLAIAEKLDREGM